MPFEILQNLLSNVWSIFLVVVFFGGSIFVHELGHFLAARRRGVHVERFSIGFGPPIWSWRGKDGVEYRLAWFPFGGYVTLPQLADLREIEGESSVDVSQLPPPSYASKMLVFVAGAAFNLLFALGLAAVIWYVGQPTNGQLATTRIGYVAPTINLPNGTPVASPAQEAGLKAGDVILAIDGQKVADWMDIVQTIVMGAGRTANGEPKTVFTIERHGKVQDISVYPQLAGPDQLRKVGIDGGYDLTVHSVAPGSVAAKAGFHPGDVLRTFDGQLVINGYVYQELLTRNAKQPLTAVVDRGGREVTLTVPPRPETKNEDVMGLTLSVGYQLTHPSPFKQVYDNVVMTFRTLLSLINPHSNIGLANMAGPIGIARILHSAAEVGIQAVLMFTILVNVNLAIFNLLPIPVLDGGQMLFATIAKLRGRALPLNFIMITQSAFVVLLFSMMIYVTVFGDIRRWIRDASANDKPAAEAPAAQP